MRNDLGYISFCFGRFINRYSELIGWIIEGRKCAAAGGDRAFPMVISLQEFVIHLLEKYFGLYLKLLLGYCVGLDVIIFMNHVVVLWNILYSRNMSWCCPKW